MGSLSSIHVPLDPNTVCIVTASTTATDTTHQKSSQKRARKQQTPLQEMARSLRERNSLFLDVNLRSGLVEVVVPRTAVHRRRVQSREHDAHVCARPAFEWKHGRGGSARSRSHEAGRTGAEGTGREGTRERASTW
jgi:hypothetical protein